MTGNKIITRNEEILRRLVVIYLRNQPRTTTLARRLP